MKKIASIALIALFTMSVFAQERRQRQQKHDFTVDQIAAIKTKKMTLLLDLNTQQQNQILEINKQKVAEHKAKKEARKAMKEREQKPTSDELFELKSKQLDAMIAHKAEMKKILNEEQFETWVQERKKKGKRIRKRGAHRKAQQRKGRK